MTCKTNVLIRLIFAIVFLTSTSVAADTVLVAGATGPSGRAIVSALLDKGLAVRAMSRSLERAAALGENVTPVAGDVTNPATLTDAVAGVDAVISAIGGRRPMGENGFKAVDWQGNKALIDATKAAGVKRFLMITAGSAGRDGFLYALPFAPYVWKAKAEEHLRQSGLDYTIIGPGGLRDEAAGEVGVRLAPRDDYIVGRVNRSDMAEVIVASLIDDNTFRTTITIINDETLPPNAWRETLGAFPKD